VTAATNPYKPGTARHSMWARREAERKAKEAPKDDVKIPETDDDSNRRKQLDKMIEGQTTDSNNA